MSLALDLATKAWAYATLRGHRPLVIIEGRLELVFAFNTGASFGLLSEPSWSRALFIGVTVFALGYLGRLSATLPDRAWLARVGVGLMMGGALGNLHDRLVRTHAAWGEEPRHGVVDFIVVYLGPDNPWPAFNIADAALLLGVVALLFGIRTARVSG